MAGDDIGQIVAEAVERSLKPVYGLLTDLKQQVTELRAGTVPRDTYDVQMHDLQNRLQAQGIRIDEVTRWQASRPTAPVSQDRFDALQSEVRDLKGRPETTRANIGTVSVIVGLVVAGLGCILGPLWAGIIAFMLTHVLR